MAKIFIKEQSVQKIAKIAKIVKFQSSKEKNADGVVTSRLCRLLVSQLLALTGKYRAIHPKLR